MSFAKIKNTYFLDIKANNILVADEKGNCKITDFGIAQVASRRQKYKVYTSIEPPEKKFSKKSDVFMFGLLLFEVLEKTPPTNSTYREIIPRIPIEENSPRSHLIRQIQQCCAEKPSDRPDFVDIVKVLTSLREEIGMTKPFPKPVYTKERDESIFKDLFVGMKLEARDLKNPTLICVATIAAIDSSSPLDEPRVLITFDGWSSNFDYWTTLRNSQHVGPIGACEAMNHRLEPPKGLKGIFNWSEYLVTTDSSPVPESFFSSPVLLPLPKQEQKQEQKETEK